MTIEERVLSLEKKAIELDKEFAGLNGKASVIIIMNTAILLFISILALK
jgi:hypothetical protein